MKEIVVVVVTYNRLKLLKENICSLLNQTVSCDILLIDNASTDGTGEYIQGLNNDRIIYHYMSSNIGGAGGFSFGVDKAITLGYKYMWLMDDDSIPQIDSLEFLLNKAKLLQDNFSFLASLVYWTDGNIFPMNIPDASFSFKERINVLKILNKYHLLPTKKGSFVGCFINSTIAQKAGLPIAEFFIYGDDIEYTTRLSKLSPAYIDIDSVIIHKAPTNLGADIALVNHDRLDRFLYQTRNRVYIAKKEGFLGFFSLFVTLFKRFCKIILYSKDNKILRIKILVKGVISGIKFNPEIKYSLQKNNCLDFRN